MDAAGRVAAYDGENRHVSFTTPGQSAVTYSYDGEGRRVSKQRDAIQRVFVYDALGMLVAEYLTSSPSTSRVQYATQDHLGSLRVIADETGSVVSRHDYLPFGQEIPSNLGLRPGIFGYAGGDAFRHRFTGKERDSESGLDFFQARFMSSFAGRFTSPDPIAESAEHLLDPQNWNRYVYTRNNPLKFVDPDGESATLVGALVGGAVGLTTGLIQGKSGRELLGSVTRGAVTGALLGLVADSGGTALLGAGGWMLAGGLANTAGGAADSLVSGHGYSLASAGLDFAGGMATGPMGLMGGSAGPDLTAARSSQLIDPKSVRFTQNSIQYSFQEGGFGNIDDMANALRSGQLKPSAVQEIRLVDRNGQLFTLDNRRLEAFRRAGVSIPISYGDSSRDLGGVGEKVYDPERGNQHTSARATQMTARKQANSVTTRHELAEFIRELQLSLQEAPNGWENSDLGRYLEAMAAWLVDMDGYYHNQGEQVPAQPDWSFIALLLSAAKVYE